MFFDTDCAAVVHNIAYLRFIEVARTLLAEQLGMGLRAMAESRQYPVVVRTEIDYRKPAVLGDKLVVHGRLETVERTRFWCAFEIRRPADGALIVQSRQLLALVQMPAGEPDAPAGGLGGALCASWPNGRSPPTLACPRGTPRATGRPGGKLIPRTAPLSRCSDIRPLRRLEGGIRQAFGNFQLVDGGRRVPLRPRQGDLGQVANRRPPTAAPTNPPRGAIARAAA